MSEHTLHISIGPVQGFVAQARRTRDLWAGSFLLSWMSGQLMAAVLQKGGQIVFPSVVKENGKECEPTDPMLASILGKPLLENPRPKIGSLPNRFKAKVPGNFDPEFAVNYATQKWQNLAEMIWKSFVENAVNGNEGQRNLTRKIWDRQIESFWEVQWVKGEHPANNGEDAKWLDSRKNWRSHWPPKECGDHCTTMGSWQELSGFVRSRQREKQDKFWSALRKNVGRLDLQDDERLCAIALVKRLFPKLENEHLKKTIGWSFQTKNWPSTAYMAVAPWLIHIAKNPALHQKLDGYVKTIRESVDDKAFKQLSGGYSTRLPGLKKLESKKFENLHHATNLDGNLFLETALANPRATPLTNDPPKTGEDDPDKEIQIREKLLHALKELSSKDVDVGVGGCAQPYYALLLMDGDRLGELLRQLSEQKVSEALAKFVEEVQRIVECNNGVTIYAGGDDVLAMLPATQAIQCARDLRDAYGKAFQGLPSGANEKPTASCAIVFSHYHNPLRDVMKLAHKELDDVAKEQNGRNSLALAVMQASGVHNRWVSQFSGSPAQPDSLEKLRNKIAENKDLYSTGFFYNLRERYGSWLSECDEKDRNDIALAEYYKGNPPKDGTKRKEAVDAVNAFLAACQTRQGKDKENNPPDKKETKESFQIDGAFIARFLAELDRFEPPKKEGNS